MPQRFPECGSAPGCEPLPSPLPRGTTGGSNRGAFVLAVLGAMLLPFEAFADDPPELLQTDSRAPYVHRITLYDHDGTAIDPKDVPAMPYSPRRTCGKCHPYDTIASGWHFNEPDANAFAGRPGEPWFLIHAETGQVQAISGRGWPGTITPAEAGLSAWDMVKRFGRHMPGGGYGTPLPSRAGPGEGQAQSARWQVSGPLEIDCLFCHSADQQHDPAEAARQIEMENFKWAATVALGLGVVRGEARKAPDDWDPFMPPNPDFPEQAGPTLVYDKARFDPDDRVLFHITRRMPNERCYFCHTTRVVGVDAPEDWHTDGDVHLRAGLLCVDCHRHGIDHAITRGYEGESEHPARISRTCRGCHLGDPDSIEIATALGGNLGAPRPEHKGFPPLHFEKLACTVCHAGSWPRDTTQRSQTALAHQLGLATRERSADDPPMLMEPVFVRGDDDVLGVQRLAPLLRPSEAAPLGWALAHPVRPAEQSVGIRDCQDCHDLDGAVFFGAIVGTEPPLAMADVNGFSAKLAQVWASSFDLRPLFKWFGFVCAALVALVSMRQVTATSVPVEHRTPAALGHKLACLATMILLLVGGAICGLTGFGGEWLYDEVANWTLLAHMAGAPLFILGLTGLAVLWPRRCSRAAGWRKLPLWLVIATGFVVMASMLAAMLPMVGQWGQETLGEIHEVSAMLLMLALLAWALTCWRRRAVTSLDSPRAAGSSDAE